MILPRHRPAAFVNPELLVVIALLAVIVDALLPLLSRLLNK